MLGSRAILNPPITTLVTGAEGFVGCWLLRHLHARGWAAVATHKPGQPAPKEPARRWVEIDLRERESVRELLQEVRPRYIVNLAAIALPQQAAANPLEALRVNYGVVDALVDALSKDGHHTCLLNVTSGQSYGARPEGTAPIREEEPLLPSTPYAATKVAAERRGLLAVQREGLDIITARPLNHSGPGRPEAYAESAFARQLVRIERGLQQPLLRVGNLEDIRDFSDVRDVVRAYTLLLERGERGEIYNVCSGRGWKIADVLAYLISRSRVKPEVVVDPSLYRPSDPRTRALVGDPSRLRALGWIPDYCFEDTLDALLEDWRARA